MGALLAVDLAARFPQRVTSLALLAPALEFQGRTMAGLRWLRNTPLLEWLRPWVTKSGTDLEDARALAEAPILPAFPIARLKDMWQLQDLVRESASRVRAPTLVVVAKQDHVVAETGARALSAALTQASSVRYVEINKGFHILPRDLGQLETAAEVRTWFANMQTSRAREKSA